MSFISVLTLIFITLKLTDFIDWSWWMVLAPVLSMLSVVIMVMIGIVLFGIGGRDEN